MTVVAEERLRFSKRLVVRTVGPVGALPRAPTIAVRRSCVNVPIGAPMLAILNDPAIWSRST